LARKQYGQKALLTTATPLQHRRQRIDFTIVRKIGANPTPPDNPVQLKNILGQ
jgi:hypothetical protein